MTETFVPLVPAPAGSRDTAFASLSVNGAAPRSSSGAAIPAVTDSGACSTPVVTLQRTGDVVSGIRVQCGCGQVVDLACVF